MTFDEIIGDVLVGSHPQGPEDIETLVDREVTAVLNLQTDDDLEWKGIDWEAFEQEYEANDIAVHRVPIRDFDREHLRERLPKAVDRLRTLLETGERVFVHCTAGVGRAPSVVVAYLVETTGVEPDRALEIVEQARPEVSPNMWSVEGYCESP